MLGRPFEEYRPSPNEVEECAPRGTAPTSWPDSNGFLGKPADTSIGLTVIGAHQYDPATARFISVDPITDSSSPSALGGYAYAANNPVTLSDPSGLYIPVDQTELYLTQPQIEYKIDNGLGFGPLLKFKMGAQRPHRWTR